MIIPYKKFSLFIDTKYFKPDKATIIFLHGFTGSSSDWKDIIPAIDNEFSCIAIDIIGHGKSSSPENYSYYELESIINQLDTIIESLQIDQIILVGYSMGGRIALNYAIQRKKRIKGLILESTTAGIKSNMERDDRFQNDKSLSQKIKNDGVELFVKYWMNLPIFSSQKILPEELINQIIRNKNENTSTGLSNSLLGFSTGKMSPLWEKLETLNLPTLLIAGGLDDKYYKLNEEMNNLLPSSSLESVNGAGHNIHLEKPSEFVILVNRFLRSNFT